MSASKCQFTILSFPPDTSFESVFQIPGVWKSRQSDSVLECPIHAVWLVAQELDRLKVQFHFDGAPPPSPLPSLPDIPGLRPEVYALLLSYQKDFIRWAAVRNSFAAFHACGAGKTLELICRALLTNGLCVIVTRASGRGHWADEIQKFTAERALVYTHPPESAKQGDRLQGAGDLLVDPALFKRAYGGIAHRTTVAAAYRAAKGEKPGYHGDERAVPVRVLAKLGRKGLAWIVLHLRYLGVGEGGYEVVDTITEGAPMPKFIITAWETLTKLVDSLVDLKPVIFLGDESHIAKQSRRTNAIYETKKVEIEQEDGSIKVEQKHILDEEGNSKVHFELKKNTTASAQRLSRAAHVRGIATATPIRDRARDLWAQLDLIEPWGWGTFRCWAFRYAGGHPTRWTTLDSSGSSNEEELRMRLSFIAHIIPRSVTHANLPPKRRETIYVSGSDLRTLTDEENKAFEEDFRKAYANGPLAIAETALAIAAARKRNFVVDQTCEALESGAKVVLFADRHKEVEALAAALRKRAPKIKVNGEAAKIWSAHGGTSVVERDEIRREYMAHPGPCGLIGGADAWGESISLHDTDLAGMVQLPYSPGKLEQREGRFTRQGQTRPVIVRYWVAEDTRDEQIANILLAKLPQVEKVMHDDEMGKVVDSLALGEGGAKALEDSILEKICAIEGELHSFGEE